MLRQHWERVACLFRQLLASISLTKVAASKNGWNFVQVKLWIVFVQEVASAQQATRQVRQGPSGRVAHGVASAAAVSALVLLAPDSAAASESASAGVLALLASACSVVRDTAQHLHGSAWKRLCSLV